LVREAAISGLIAPVLVLVVSQWLSDTPIVRCQQHDFIRSNDDRRKKTARFDLATALCVIAITSEDHNPRLVSDH